MINIYCMTAAETQAACNQVIRKLKQTDSGLTESLKNQSKKSN